MSADTNARELNIPGFEGLNTFHWNWTPARFYEAAIAKGEGKVAKGGSLVVKELVLHLRPPWLIANVVR